MPQPALGNGCVSSWIHKKMQEQKTYSLQLSKATRKTQEWILLSESNCWLENLSKPRKALKICSSAVWHTSLGIPLFYDVYHTMNNVGLEGDGKDQYLLESWEHASCCCRAWLSRLFLTQYVMLCNKEWKEEAEADTDKRTTPWLIRNYVFCTYRKNPATEKHSINKVRSHISERGCQKL